MSDAPAPWVEAVLSLPRFAPYLAAAAGDADAALELEWWNLEVASAFVVPLNRLELGLRNRVHPRLCERFGRPDWWEVAPLDPNGRRKIVEARRALAQLRRPEAADDVVAQLTFGFWISLISSRYHRSLWVPVLHRVFPGAARRDVHADLQRSLVLRNRIMHHEPIHHRHLEADHATVYRLLGYLSAEMLPELESRDRVPELLGSVRPASGRCGQPGTGL